MPVRQRNRLDLFGPLQTKSRPQDHTGLLKISLADEDLREKLPGNRVLLVGTPELRENLARSAPAAALEFADSGVDFWSPLEIFRLFPGLGWC